MLRQTSDLMKRLRLLNLNEAQKIDTWVDHYLDESIVNGKSVTIITPWSVYPNLPKRRALGSLSPTRGEKNLFEKKIPRIVEIFFENGFSINWWFSFSRQYIEKNRVPFEIERDYVEMIETLATENNFAGAFVSWQDDVLQVESFPNPTLFELDEPSFKRQIGKERFSDELERRWKKWRDREKINITPEDLEKETIYKICCEAEEGRFLMEDPNNPICEPGKFLLMPIVSSQRLVFFSSIVQDFKKRIVSILKTYPWRE